MNGKVTDLYYGLLAVQDESGLVSGTLGWNEFLLFTGEGQADLYLPVRDGVDPPVETHGRASLRGDPSWSA